MRKFQAWIIWYGDGRVEEEGDPEGVNLYYLEVQAGRSDVKRVQAQESLRHPWEDVVSGTQAGQH